MSTGLSIVHRLALPDPKTHLVHVEMRISGALPPSLVLFMAVWTPGSYLTREYARHVEGFEAQGPARATKIRKNAWQVERVTPGPLVVRYRVYANELSVRTSHVDETHAFLAGASVFLGIQGMEHLPARVEIEAPPGWRITTPLRPSGAAYEADDFDMLVDSPIEIGTQNEEAFQVLGTRHRYAFWPAGSVRATDTQRLVDDTRRIIETEAKLFGGALPYASYDLLLHLSTKSRGGLEHRASAALIASPATFTTREAYLDLLSLVAHEVFHAWSVKRIRPAGLVPYRYEGECYTRLLWWFEGATSYYDWRILVLAGLCTPEEYLEHLAAEIAYLDATPGRLVHPLEEASFDAWIKLYRPDENSANSSVSYYRKGEVVCALLDLEIRARTQGKATLDHVQAHLWSAYGARELPVPEDAMQSIFENVTGVSLGDRFDAWIRGVSEIDYGAVLASVGLQIERTSRSESASCSLGFKVRTEGGRGIVAAVTRQGAAWNAGIDAGDEIIAIAGTRIDGAAIEPALRGRPPGERVDVLVARDGQLLTKQVTLDPPKQDRVKIVARAEAPAAAREAFVAWLGGTLAAWTSGGSAS